MDYSAANFETIQHYRIKSVLDQWYKHISVSERGRKAYVTLGKDFDGVEWDMETIKELENAVAVAKIVLKQHEDVIKENEPKHNL
jgi:hypothetical protein